MPPHSAACPAAGKRGSGSPIHARRRRHGLTSVVSRTRDRRDRRLDVRRVPACGSGRDVGTHDGSEGVAAVVAKDANTLVVTYKDTQPFFYQWGVGTEAGVLSKAQYSGCVGDKAKNCPADLKPIGTGPYKLVDFKPGDVVT